MPVFDQPLPEATRLPDIHHATWAGAAHGLRQLSVWRQSIAPGAATPPHRHDSDEVVLCLSGTGEIHFRGRTYPFSARHTLALPRDEVHQLINTGTEALEIIGIFAATPVVTRHPDGEALALPWHS